MGDGTMTSRARAGMGAAPKVLLVVMLLAAVACGNADDDDSGGSAAPDDTGGAEATPASGAPGDYMVVAFGSSDLPITDEKMKALAANAPRVTLRSNERQTVDLTVPASK